MTIATKGFNAVDLKDSDLHKAGTPHEVFAWLRANDPVHWNPESDGPGFWAITRYADIVTASTNPTTFSSAREFGGHRIFDENDVADATVETSMISMDPPEHLDYRKMLMPGFTPARLREMEAGIRARAVTLIDKMIARAAANGGTVDFVDAFAAPYAIQTLAELFGVSEDDGDKLFEWSNAIVAEEDPELRPSQDYVNAKIMEMIQYSFGLRELRVSKPGNDLVSMMANATIDGEPMAPGKFLATFILVVVAGNETTRNSLTGSMIAFDQFPQARAAVQANPELLRSCAQEIVRWVSPVHHMRRTALKDTELGGKAIKKGDKIVLWYASGNRDEAVFDAPFTFDPARYENPAVPKHVGFGTGQHVCLGQRLAELQIKVAYEELFERLPNIRPIGAGGRVRSNFINGWKDLPVTLG